MLSDNTIYPNTIALTHSRGVRLKAASFELFPTSMNSRKLKIAQISRASALNTLYKQSKPHLSFSFQIPHVQHRLQPIDMHTAFLLKIHFFVHKVKIIPEQDL